MLFLLELLSLRSLLLEAVKVLAFCIGCVAVSLNRRGSVACIRTRGVTYLLPVFDRHELTKSVRGTIL